MVTLIMIIHLVQIDGFLAGNSLSFQPDEYWFGSIHIPTPLKLDSDNKMLSGYCQTGPYLE